MSDKTAASQGIVGAVREPPSGPLSTQHPARSTSDACWRSFDWRLIPSMPTSPVMNMALDAVLTERVGAGKRPATLRIWGWDASCVVLGRFQSVRNEIDEEGLRGLGISFVR